MTSPLSAAATATCGAVAPRHRITWKAALAAGLLSLGLGSQAQPAPPASSTPAAATPSFSNTIGQRSQACSGCHGVQGRAGPDGFYPRIAGKPAGYLYNQLVNFRDGRRHYPLMSHLLQTMTDDYLRELADHFAQLDLPYPAPTGRPSAEVAALGEKLVRQGDPVRNIPACVQCHGDTMTGVAPSIPGLLGLPREYLSAQMGAWRAGIRHAHAPDCMREVANRLSVAEADAVAAWLAAQPVPGSAKPATALPGPLPMPCGGIAQGGAR